MFKAGIETSSSKLLYFLLPLNLCSKTVECLPKVACILVNCTVNMSSTVSQNFTKSPLLSYKYPFNVSREYSTLLVVLPKCIIWSIHTLSIFSFKGSNIVVLSQLRNFVNYSQTFLNCTLHLLIGPKMEN